MLFYLSLCAPRLVHRQPPSLQPAARTTKVSLLVKGTDSTPIFNSCHQIVDSLCVGAPKLLKRVSGLDIYLLFVNNDEAHEMHALGLLLLGQSC
jgi:hypothetical protein